LRSNSPKRIRGYPLFYVYILCLSCKNYEKEFRKEIPALREPVLYLKCKDDVEVRKADVYLKDIATMQCSDESICKKCREIKIHHFEKQEDRFVISVLKVIQLISLEYPGILVQSVGERDILIEKVQDKANKGWRKWLKVVLVCFISFFGTAFTIISYNNDISINGVFERIYDIFGAEAASEISLLELSYALGLAAGIIIFFNHIGGRRITKDPTPIEVSMRNYERDVNQALIETADREGMEDDV